MIVITAISAHNEYVKCEYVQHICVVYSLKGANPDQGFEISCAPHGNSKQSTQFLKLYIQTNPSVVAQMDSFLENYIRSNVKYLLSTSKQVR